MEKAVRVLEIAAQDAEQMSEWPDRKERSGSALKARAVELRKAARILTDMEMTMGLPVDGVAVSTEDDRVTMAGRDHTADVAGSVARCLEELVRMTFHQEGVVQARETESADLWEQRQEMIDAHRAEVEELKQSIQTMQDQVMDTNFMSAKLVIQILHAEEEVKSACAVLFNLFRAMDKKAVGKSAKVTHSAQDTRNRLITLHHRLGSFARGEGETYHRKVEIRVPPVDEAGS